jgi:ribosomal protein S18 acetylase RimI-like enzyme
MPHSIVIASTASLREAALTLLFSPLSASQRDEQLASVLAAARRHELSLDHLVIALDRDQLLGAVLAVMRPGGAAFLWPPVARAGSRADEVSTSLLESIAAQVDEQGAVFTQCLLDPSDTRSRATLDRGGFPYVTDLILLSRPTAVEGVGDAGVEGVEMVEESKRPSDQCSSTPLTPSTLSVESYSADSHAAFARLVERTYEGTLDCPVLARLRGGEDSLEAHRATGRFAPDAWRLYRREGQDVGVLLLAEHPDRDLWEVAYLGVVPEARGRGVGRAILRDALALAQRSGRSAIEIAVDAGNIPALRLYRDCGFIDVRRFAVHLRVRIQ